MRPKSRLSSFNTVINGALIVALLGTVATCYNERRNGADLAVRAKDLDRINQFQDTGIAVDQAWVDFNSAMKSGKDIEKSRAAFLKVARQHASQTNELGSLIGRPAVDIHLGKLQTLQNEIREAHGFGEYGKRRTALADYISSRNNLVLAAKTRPL